MVLKSYKTYNFGILNNEEGVFLDTISSFHKENGTGKTTLSEFIVAMLFGMPNVSTRTLSEIRSAYKPFNDGKFGGELTLLSNGAEYKIERTFDEKKPANDTCVITKNGVEISFEKEIGEVLLGIDYETFRKIVFVSGESMKVGETSQNIQSKLSTTIADVDKESLDNAINLLNKEASELTKRKTGKIAVLYEKIEKNEKLAHELRTVIETTGVIQNRVCLSRTKEQELLCKYNEYQKIETAIGRHQNYEQLKKQLESKEFEARNIRSKYPKEIPNDEILFEIQKTDGEIEENNSKIVGSSFVDQNALKQERLDELLGDAERFTRYGEPTSEEQKKSREMLIDISRCEVTEENLNNDISEEQNNLNKKLRLKKSFLLISVILSVAIIIGSVVLSFILSKYYFILVGLLIDAFLLVIPFVCINGKKSDKLRKMLLEQEKNLSRKNDDLRELDSIALKYGYDIEDYSEFVECFNKDVLKYKTYLENSKNVRDELFKNKLQFEKMQLELKNRNDGLRERLYQIFGTYGLEVPEDIKIFVNNVKIDLENLTKIDNEIQSLKDTIKDYYVANKDYLSIDISRETNITQLENDIKEIKIEREHNEEELDKITESEEQLSSILREIKSDREELDSLTKRANVVARTAFFLNEAYNSITSEYVEPVQKSLTSFINKINGIGRFKIIVTPEFELKYDSGMGTKKASVLSTGLQCVLELCYKMALSDNISLNDTPFVILDDPFMSLDEQNLYDAKCMLKALSFNKQIIYFTCHESRIIDT